MDSLKEEQSLNIYKVEIPLKQNYLVSKNGDITFLLSGMTAEARIIFKKEPIINLLLEKLEFI